MDGAVQRLRCRYRVAGGPAAALRARRLDDTLRPRLAAVLGEALDQALAGDPSVWVVRRVRSTVALRGDDGDDALARAWGERLAGSVVRTLAADPGDGANLVRFDDQADYVARFVGDLLAGQAWERWYYLAFRALRARPREAALVAVLLDHRRELPAILALLAQRGRLEALLAALPPRSLAELWRLGLAGRPEVAGEDRRPLFAAALGLLRALGLPALEGPGAEALFRDWCAGGAAGDADWSRPEALAQGVADALGFLVRRGAIDRRRLAAAARRVQATVAPLDWLDRELLAAAVARLADGVPGTLPRRGPTPRLRRLLADLAAAAHRLGRRLDAAAADSASRALALAAALYAQAPEWRGETLAVEVIERLLAARDALAGRPRAESWLRWLEGGTEPPDPGAGGGEGSTGAVRRTLTPLCEWGAPAAAAVRGLLTAAPAEVAARPAPHRAPEPPAPAAETGLDTLAAGSFLLLRGLRDLRLPDLAAAAVLREGLPAAGGETARAAALVAALAERWAGLDAGGPPDAALSLLAGGAGTADRRRLATAFATTPAADLDRLQLRLLATAAGQRLADGSTLRLFRLAGGTVVAQAGRGDLWPLGRPAAPDAELLPAVDGWLAAFEEAFAAPPSIASADASLLAALPEREGWPPWIAVEPEVDGRGGEAAGERADAGAGHAAARRRLAAALGSLGAGADRAAADRGGADHARADLTATLAATVVLHAWARWLRGFATASVPFLLDAFVRRGGRVWEGTDALEVELDPRPLDLVLEMAGYLAPLEWPAGRTVRFRRRGAP